jgi:hypothetical protein
VALASYQEYIPNTFYFYNSDLRVDVMFQQGRVYLENADGTKVELAKEGGLTKYTAFTGEEEARTSVIYYDFNQDGVRDTVKVGKMKPLPDANGEIVDTFVAQDDPEH